MDRLLWLLLLVPVLPALGMAYQVAGALKDRRRYIGLGRLIEMGEGRQIYLSDMGRGGASPTVVFESGIAATSQNWLRVQEAVAGYTRAVSYDRGGLGWSSECVSERTPSNIARELRQVLRQAGIPGPYVLVGHSFGGLVVRRFAALYPDAVAGAILVDPMRTEEWPPVNEQQRALLERGIRMAGFGVPVARFGLARLATTSLLCRSGRTSRAFSRAAGPGGLHVMQRITCEVSKMPREVWPIVASHWASPKYYRGLAAHLTAVPATVTEMHAAEAVVGVPVVLLTPGSAEPLCSERLRHIGSDVRQVIAHHSGHWVHLDEPELVLGTIRGVVEEAVLASAAAMTSTGAPISC
ncbi:MAG TPA: alpha/beta hydrolase [Acidobacteriaceae bacterium]|jgi:pimeloyl-ACP methyl ester carboxylesterase